MKFDMHCHTAEGSPDAGVRIEDYILRLMELGYGGMLVADHDSYNGYRKWKRHIKGKRYKDFVVLKGIEYDTIDGGHILVIMPEDVKLRILELRGLPVRLLIDIVHRHGGILGPAHPCGERYLSLIHTKKKRDKEELLRKFDFIEDFNSCETLDSNQKAKQLSDLFEKPGFGGSDSHRYDCIGTAWTELPASIRCESDLIRYIKGGGTTETGGTYYNKTTKKRIGALNHVLVQMFYFYNHAGSIAKSRKRKRELKKYRDIF